jgi:hypothetical protein
MSRIEITDEHPLSHLVPDGATAYELTGDDMPAVGAIIDPSGTAPTVVKSLRLPDSMVQAAAAANHPEGFSGVVREALTEWLERHTGTAAAQRDARQALATLQRVVDSLASAA